MNITILGSGSATPSLLRNPSAHIVADNHENYLIDCGEGTQFQLIRCNIKVNKIKNIFISHLHGDHYFGLIGLISSMNLSHRTEPLTLYGPKGLDQIITIQLKYANTLLHFNLEFVEIDPIKATDLIDNEYIKITTIPLDHRIDCTGFLFQEKPKKRSLVKDKLPKNILVEEIKLLKEGKDVCDEFGNVKYSYELLTVEHKIGKSYAYCSDTAYSEKIIEIIKNVDLLYHEATFKQDLADRAAVTHHSTAFQAATIAKKAMVGKLIIGHFSSRYHDLESNLEEAKIAFMNTEIAYEGNTYLI